MPLIVQPPPPSEIGFESLKFQRAAIVVGVFGTSLYLLLLVFVDALGFTSEILSLVLILGLLMTVVGHVFPHVSDGPLCD